MARTARAATVVPLAPEGALGLWTNVERWPTFVEGFKHTVEVSDDWPAEGGRVVWESGPGGRGRVTEKVVEDGTGRFATRVSEDALQGRQALSVSEDAEGTRVELTLEYELTKYGPLRTVADLIFIRRALRDALRRTLRRFAVEAEEEAGLR
ncbi:MAG TPA: SRPBCC family protein [Thermoleophilaceae bacterium]|nr:SRPBCC family protein [Thermoleophilaceae bacterium]